MLPIFSFPLEISIQSKFCAHKPKTITRFNPKQIPLFSMAQSPEAAPSDSTLKLVLSIVHTSAGEFKIDWAKVCAMNDIANASTARMRWTRLKAHYKDFLGEKPGDDAGVKTPKTPATVKKGARGDETPSKSTGKGRKKKVDAVESVEAASSEDIETIVKTTPSKSTGKGRKKEAESVKSASDDDIAPSVEATSPKSAAKGRKKKAKDISASDSAEKVVKRVKVEESVEDASKVDSLSEMDGMYYSI
jgi:hypothetical protein